MTTSLQFMACHVFANINYFAPNKHTHWSTLMDWKCFCLFGFANHLHRTKVCHKNSILHLFTILVISIYTNTHLHNKTPAVSALCTAYVIKNVVPNEMNATKQLFALSHSIISLQMFLHFWSNSWKFNKEIEFKKKSSFQQVH